MLKNPDGPLPRMNALRAFEAAAHHVSFSAAAEELGIRQPTVSRYIADLEHEIGVRLFERSPSAVVLTPAGEVFHRAVAIGLERIVTGALSASGLADDRRIVIACGGATSELFLRPRLGALHRVLGEDRGHPPPALRERLPVPPERGGDFDRIDLIAGYHSVDGLPGMTSS